MHKPVTTRDDNVILTLYSHILHTQYIDLFDGTNRFYKTINWNDSYVLPQCCLIILKQKKKNQVNI